MVTRFVGHSADAGELGLGMDPVWNISLLT
jgi:hypothetical protein